MLHTTDQDLLLLIHNELTAWRSIAAQAHVAVCPRCQMRLAKLVGASRLLADAVRGGDLPRWSLTTPQQALLTARIATVLRLTALFCLIITSIAISNIAIHSFQKPEPRVTSPLGRTPGDGCRPDLHNDNCR